MYDLESTGKIKLILNNINYWFSFHINQIKRDIFNKTLCLDSELWGHYSSDRKFSDFIRHYLQLKIYQTPDAFVYHSCQIATNTLRKKCNSMYAKNQGEPKLAKKNMLQKSNLGFLTPKI